jgi:hypothetical protein
LQYEFSEKFCGGYGWDPFYTASFASCGIKNTFTCKFLLVIFSKNFFWYRAARSFAMGPPTVVGRGPRARRDMPPVIMLNAALRTARRTRAYRPLPVSRLNDMRNT